jgi:hypothetical protein
VLFPGFAGRTPSFRRSRQFIPGTDRSDKVIVRVDSQNRMVTKDYQKGVYDRCSGRSQVPVPDPAIELFAAIKPGQRRQERISEAAIAGASASAARFATQRSSSKSSGAAKSAGTFTHNRELTTAESTTFVGRRNFRTNNHSCARCFHALGARC